MDEATVRRLNQLNRDFYEVTAAEFDRTRGQPWPGWQPLLKYIKTVSILSVLDVGCGNGRFGVFLHNHLIAKSTIQQISYLGIDNNSALLAHARQSLTGLSAFDARLEERDIVENPPDTGLYDLVVLFGVLHHIPGYHSRLALMRGLTQRLAPGGLLAFACWRFYEYERFRSRIMPWPPDVRVERHDHLLDWRQGETALRYCHYVDDTEHAALVNVTGLTEVASYRADGQTDDANRYSILENLPVVNRPN
jgi:SAM-dependent methyltransferase